MAVVSVRPGETVVVVGLPSYTPGLAPSHPIMLPGMPGWGVGQPQPGVDPGYGIDVGTGYPGNPPRPTHPISLPGDPWWGTSPPTEPPPTEPPPQEGGKYIWAWSPQLQRWVWVKIPGEGEAAPKA